MATLWRLTQTKPPAPSLLPSRMATASALIEEEKKDEDFGCWKEAKVVGRVGSESSLPSSSWGRQNQSNVLIEPSQTLLTKEAKEAVTSGTDQSHAAVADKKDEWGKPQQQRQNEHASGRLQGESPNVSPAAREPSKDHQQQQQSNIQSITLNQLNLSRLCDAGADSCIRTDSFETIDIGGPQLQPHSSHQEEQQQQQQEALVITAEHHSSRSIDREEKAPADTCAEEDGANQAIFPLISLFSQMFGTTTSTQATDKCGSDELSMKETVDPVGEQAKARQSSAGTRQQDHHEVVFCVESETGKQQNSALLSMMEGVMDAGHSQVKPPGDLKCDCGGETVFQQAWQLPDEEQHQANDEEEKLAERRAPDEEIEVVVMVPDVANQPPLETSQLLNGETRLLRTTDGSVVVVLEEEAYLDGGAKQQEDLASILLQRNVPFEEFMMNTQTRREALRKDSMRCQQEMARLQSELARLQQQRQYHAQELEKRKEQIEKLNAQELETLQRRTKHLKQSGGAPPVLCEEDDIEAHATHAHRDDNNGGDNPNCGVLTWDVLDRFLLQQCNGNSAVRFDDSFKM